MKINKGYRYLYKNEVPEEFHSMLDNYNHCLEHRLVMAMYIGRPLLSSEIVHHKDEDKLNNSIDNLELTTRSEHQKYHAVGNDNGKYSRKFSKCLLCDNIHKARGLCNKHYKRVKEGRLTAEDKELAREMYNQVPDEHKFLFEEYMNE